MNSIVSLYNLLKAEYPNKVWVGQFAQSVDLTSASANILLVQVDETPSGNKDNNKRDAISFRIDIIGSSYSDVLAKAKNIRNICEPYNDEYIYLVKYDNTFVFHDDEPEVYRRVVELTVYENGDGLNSPTGYYEHYVNLNFLNGNVTILNQNDLNYLPITWSWGGQYTFNTIHTYEPSDIVVFFEMPNNQGTISQIVNECYTGNLDLTLYPGDTFQETLFLIRVRKDVSGQFLTGT